MATYANFRKTFYGKQEPDSSHQDPSNPPLHHPEPHGHHHPPGHPPGCCGGPHDHHMGSYYMPYGYAHPDLRRKRTTYTPDQLEILEVEYERDRYMDTYKRTQLARRLGLSEPQVKIWFQNRRAKDKREMRYGVMDEDENDHRPPLKSRGTRLSMPTVRRFESHNQHISKLSNPRRSYNPQDYAGRPLHPTLQAASDFKPSPRTSVTTPTAIFTPQQNSNGITEVRPTASQSSAFLAFSAYDPADIAALAISHHNRCNGTIL